jgi:hypothetical protein
VSEATQRSITELLANHALVTAAITRAVRRAVLEHARAGRPVAAWQDGKVVWISPEEILARFANDALSAGAGGEPSAS